MEEAQHQQPPFFDVIVRARMPGAEGPGELMKILKFRFRKTGERIFRKLEEAMEERRITWRWKVQRQIANALKIDLQGDSDPSQIKNEDL